MRGTIRERKSAESPPHPPDLAALRRATSPRKRGEVKASYPPLEGEGRREAAGWGDGLSIFNCARVERSPHPV
ncbi:MAG: hypothetical protein E8A46_29410 [Bradyrhizobium sp.]|nr:MAG: hypothetical protein E8A46_29410 [Bradyrhizobium sp.]